MHDELQRHNRIATVVLLIAGTFLLFVVAVAAGVLLLGVGGGAWPTDLASIAPLLVFALAVAGGGAVAGWWTSDRIALAASRARPAERGEYPDLHRLVDGLCIASGLPKPRLHVVDDPAPNAFATGRNEHHAAVAVTTGLLEKLERRELEAVLAHELGHIVNRDLFTVTIAVTLAGASLLLADLTRRTLFWGGGRQRSRRDGTAGPVAILLLVGALIAIVLVPIAVQLIRFAVSRQREYLADATSVELTRDPRSMIAALERLQEDTTVVTASRATAHLWIEEPLDVSRRANRLVATHPQLADRIDRLHSLYPQADLGP